MKTLDSSTRGYLSPAYADGAAIAAAEYTGAELTLSNATAHSIPPGVLHDPSGTIAVARTASAGARASFNVTASSSDVREAVRAMFAYSRQPNVVDRTEEKRGVKQVRIVANACR